MRLPPAPSHQRERPSPARRTFSRSAIVSFPSSRLWWTSYEVVLDADVEDGVAGRRRGRGSGGGGGPESDEHGDERQHGGDATCHAWLLTPLREMRNRCFRPPERGTAAS